MYRVFGTGVQIGGRPGERRSDTGEKNLKPAGAAPQDLVCEGRNQYLRTSCGNNPEIVLARSNSFGILPNLPTCHTTLSVSANQKTTSGDG